MIVKIWRPDGPGRGPVRIELKAENLQEVMDLGMLHQEANHSSILMHLESWDPPRADGGVGEVAIETYEQDPPEDRN